MYSGRESKGVGDKLFTTVRDHWDILITRISACLTGVKVKVSTWIRRQLRVWPLDKLLDSDSDMFHRGDYKSLAMLVRIYLTGDIHQFRFAKPIKTSHARFLQKGI